MSALTLSQASVILDAALAAARDQGHAPLAVIVLDAGAHGIALKREDGATFLRARIAEAKARAALGMGYGTRELARRAGANPAFYAALSQLADGAPPSPGGVLIRNASGEVIGAAGASGDTGDADEICIVAGIRAAGLTPDPGLAS